MNNTFRWIILLVIGVVIGFMVSLLFNNGEDVATTEPPPQVVEETPVSTEATDSEAEDTSSDDATANNDNVFAQKGCIQCHDVSPLGLKGNGTGPDLAIAYEDVQKRFGKSLEEFLDEPEGTMSAVFGQTPLTDEEKQEVIKLIKEYGGK